MRQFTWPAERAELATFFREADAASGAVAEKVAQIVRGVRERGDAALLEFTEAFDHVHLTAETLEVPAARLAAAWEATPPKLQRALKAARRRILAFHKTQTLKGWTINEPGFGRLTQRVLPLARVAVYAPGGKAAYPSSVLMDVLPAQVAGVKEIILLTPPQGDGWPDPRTLAAAHLAGVKRVLRIGGAQAVAAVAYGTETLPRVDKVVGPGNIWVATAKQQLYGQIDIDAIAGPSEVLVLADAAAPLGYVAADLLAQAEHDEAASVGAVIVGGGTKHLTALTAEVERQLAALPRNAIAALSWRERGYLVTVRTAAQAVEIANLKAPEHLQVMIGAAAESRKIADQIVNAGAIFVGPWSPVPLGDYLAGPNHTLPTAGTARFFSPLSVWSFYKTSHTVEATRAGLAALAPDLITLAEAEGLTAHAEAVKRRFASATPQRRAASRPRG